VDLWSKIFEGWKHRNLAFDQNRDSASRGCTPQVAEKDSKHLVERYGLQQK